MTVQVYKSTDGGAPVLSGTIGVYIPILDAILVNGYNTKTITITRSGSTATANCTAHGFNADQVLIISGADQAEYNITVNRPTIVDANNFSFPVTGTPATPSTGTISCKVKPAGWTKAFSGTNQASYLKPLGNQFYLDVADLTAQNAYHRGYEAMTAVGTGTGAFPTTVQVATSSGNLWKSNQTSGAVASWMAFVTGKTLWFVGSASMTVAVTASNVSAVFFGDFLSENPGDAYNTMLIGASNTGTAGEWCTVQCAGAAQGHWIVRNNSQSGTCIQGGKWAEHMSGNMNNLMESGGSNWTFTYPTPTNSSLLMCRFYVHDGTASALRGYLPGIMCLMHNNPASLGDTFSGTGAYAGRKFIILGSSGNQAGRTAFEISDTY